MNSFPLLFQIKRFFKKSEHVTFVFLSVCNCDFFFPFLFSFLSSSLSYEVCSVWREKVGQREEILEILEIGKNNPVFCQDSMWTEKNSKPAPNQKTTMLNISTWKCLKLNISLFSYSFCLTGPLLLYWSISLLPRPITFHPN